MLEDNKKYNKYANLEVERKFLLTSLPVKTTPFAEITDYYIKNTTLRLRQSKESTETKFKLGQKFRQHPDDPKFIWHTSIYLSGQEFALLHSGLPSHELKKKRFTINLTGVMMSIDQFNGQLEGLIIGEVDFGATSNPMLFEMPSFAVAVITNDERFAGEQLAKTSKIELREILTKFNISLS